jgi:RNA polymerase sigma-70 factor (ECF subfamily)
VKPGSFLKDSGSESLERAEQLLNIAFSQMGTSEEAEDVVQEACLRALRFFPGFRGDDGRAWFMKIVRNTCYTLSYSSRKHSDAAEFDENLLSVDSCVPNPEQAVLQNDRDNLLRKALQNLPVNFREILIFREFEEMSYREIAYITGMPVGTVMSCLSRARHRLRQALITAMNGSVLQSSTLITAADRNNRKELPA